MKSPRSYTMKARAQAVEQTRRQILDATVALHLERLVSEVGLDHIAERAGVSVQTVLRHFGSRAELIEATFAHAAPVVQEERRAPAGDVDAAVRSIMAHYEARGDGVLILLAQERTEELARRITQVGRKTHRTWVKEVFTPLLRGRADAEQLLDLLVVATDVYTWKLLRRDRGLSRQNTEERIKHLVSALLADTNSRGKHV
ncbi:MAG: helix-turn-helix domain-containing protein [Myxococcota bacterium]